MRFIRKYGILLIALALLLWVVAYANFWLREPLEEYLAVQIADEEGEEIVYVWSNEDDEYFFFLPVYADLYNSRVILYEGKRICLNGRDLENGNSCSEFELNVPYELTYSERGTTRETTLTFLQSSNVPTMYIDTLSGNMDYMHAMRGNEEEGKLRIYLPDGTLDYSGNVKSLSGRGNSTWDEYEKKPYDIKLEQQGNLLGMGAAEKWILLANASDSSNMRNKIAYDFAANAQMMYSPASQWVELYLNGDYVGLYLLCEKNEIHSERINIGSEGTFLVSQEAEGRLMSKKIPYIKTLHSQVLRIREANLPVEEIETIWQSAENAIVSEDGYDTTTGKMWNDLIDLDSWARKYLIEELFGNIDAGFSSEYFYFDSNTAKIYAGPVWDYDYAMYEPYGFFALRHRAQVDVPTPWYRALFDKPVFQEYVIQLYIESFVPLVEELIRERIDGYQQYISKAAAMDGIRWERAPEEFQESVKGIKQYFSERISFLTSVWVDIESYYFVEVDNRLGRNIVIYAVEPGDNLEQTLLSLSISEDTLLGWFDLETNNKIDLSETISKDMSIYAVWGTMGLSRHLPTLLPIGLIAVMFLGFLCMDIMRNKGRWHK